MCPACRAFVPADQKVCPYCDTELPARSSLTTRLSQLTLDARFTTFILITVNFGLYLATAIYSWKRGNPAPFVSIDARTLFDFGAKLTEAVFAGQWWRLITAGFLHGGIFHILMNSWVLFDLGGTVEQVYGASRMIVIYVVATITGFLASCWWSPGLSVGSSAALFGLIGAMIAFGALHRTSLGVTIRRMYVRWALYGLIFGLLVPMIDNAAHLGGLVGGFVTAYAAGLPETSPLRRERAWHIAAVVAVLLLVWAFLEMWRWWMSWQNR